MTFCASTSTHEGLKLRNPSPHTTTDFKTNLDIQQATLPQANTATSKRPKDIYTA